MINNSQNLFSLPDLPNIPSRFKPYSLHQINFTRYLPCNPRKRYYKHIRNLNVKTHSVILPKRILMPKTLHSLRLDGAKSDKKLSFVKKIVKPLKKSLRSIQGNYDHPQIQKLLPLLADLLVSLTQESFSILSLHSNFKKLRFMFRHEKQGNMSGEQLVMKYKARLSRNFTKIKGLKSMSMMVWNQDVKSANIMLEILDQNLPLESLEKYSLSFIPSPFSKTVRRVPPYEPKKSISKIVGKITHLNTDSPAWYSFLISSGKLENLSVLQLELSSWKFHWDSKDLFRFHHLPKLREFKLNLTADSESSELNFFENFSLPSTLEDFSLNLTGFALSQINENPALSNQFSERLQLTATGVKTLSIIVAENAQNLAFAAKFYFLFVKGFGHLETLECKNVKEQFLPFRKEGPGAGAKPLDFQEFWASLQPSKETLQTLSVNISEIIFPEDIDVLECGFPRLHKLRLEENVSSEAVFGSFCQRIPSLRDVVIRGVKFADEKKLEKWLNDLKEIPKGGSFEFYLMVRDIKPEALTDCLMKCFENGKAKSKVGIYLCDVQVKDKQDQEYKELLRIIKEQQCFYLFQIFSTTYYIFKVTEFLG